MISKQLESTLHNALSIATQNHHDYATFEHLLLAMLSDADTIAVMDTYNVDIPDLRKNLVHYIAHELTSLVNKKSVEAKPTAGFQRVIHRAAVTCNATAQKNVTSAHILSELFLEDESYALTCLKEHHLSRVDVISYISKNAKLSAQRAMAALYHNAPLGDISQSKKKEREEVSSPSKEPKKSARAVESYCTNLNTKAIDGTIDKLIGRDDEVQRTIEILCRRQKNNAILVGEPGVGKTAIAEGLALRITRNEVPPILKNTTIYALDLSSLVAGTRYRGDFEERINSLIEEIKNKDDVVLFIDEIHNMIGAGATAGGSLDASNLLKPALARGEIRCIGSTTFKEFRNHFEKDVALVRRFQKVLIAEPSEEATVKILEGLKDYYEEHHNVRYDHEALRAAVHLSERYITDRQLPDKAIDLIDEAGARKKILGSKSNIVTEKDIEEIVAMVAHLPSIIVAVDDMKKLQKLESNLRRSIFGQDKAISELCASIKLSKAGLRRIDRPTGCYLFAGTTGVGKTELAKQLAKSCSMELIRFDMSEYSESNTVSRLIGTPPGYVGFDQGGLLTEAVAKSPYSVVLFDEIEKANQEIFNLLLQVMDHGSLTDSTGKEVNFAHSIIIMTTNSGVDERALSPLGFGSNDRSKPPVDIDVIKREFSPEFCSRLDNIIIFNKLSDPVIKLIIEKGIKELAAQLADKNVKLVIDKSVEVHLAGVGFDSAHGARLLSRIIDTELKERIADEILFGKLKKGGVVRIFCEKNELLFKFERANGKVKVMESA